MFGKHISDPSLMFLLSVSQVTKFRRNALSQCPETSSGVIYLQLFGDCSAWLYWGKLIAFIMTHYPPEHLTLTLPHSCSASTPIKNKWNILQLDCVFFAIKPSMLCNAFKQTALQLPLKIQTLLKKKQTTTEKHANSKKNHRNNDKVQNLTEKNENSSCKYMKRQQAQVFYIQAG